MSDINMNLLSPLVGLVRSIDGNQSITTSDTALLVCRVISKLDCPISDEEQKSLIMELTTEKKRIVPDCFSCMNPCGRTFNLNPELVNQDRPSMREAKSTLLRATCPVARAALAKYDQIPDNIRDFFYQAIFCIGFDYENDMPTELLKSMPEI